MELRQYLKKNKITVAIAAKELNTSKAHLHEICKKSQTAGKKLALAIQEWSCGNVKFFEVLFTDEELIRSRLND